MSERGNEGKWRKKAVRREGDKQASAASGQTLNAKAMRRRGAAVGTTRRGGKGAE